MVVIDSIQLEDNLYIRVDKFPRSGVNPKTKLFEDIGFQYLFSLYTKIYDPYSNLLVAQCTLRDDSVLERFGVHKDFYGNGYGTALINYIKSFASVKGYSSLKTYIPPFSENLSFFKKIGFDVLEHVTIDNKLLVEIELAIELKPELKEIMCYTNGHDSSLVDTINWIGNDPTRKPMLFSILKFLANKNIDKCRTYINLEGEVTDEVIEIYGRNILTKVCDNKDLETIISYCRINCFLAQDKERYKDVDDIINHFTQPFPRDNS